MRNIILCGFMGCGKSTVGSCLAALTGRPFVDMDTEIERQAGMTVLQIFEKYGEADFRRRERELSRSLAGRRGLIIAAGGGALTFRENAETLAETGDIVLLDVPLSEILQRLSGDSSRPLMAGPDKEKAAEELYERRLPLYRAAARVVVDANQTAGQVARAVCRALDIDV